MSNVKKTYPRDVLMNLLVMVALYISVTTFLQLIFAFINEFLPDPLNQYYSSANAIRWPLSMIIIIFPVYIFISRFLHRDLVANPEKNELHIRRWLIYVTIFMAGGLIVGDLVALIFGFLQGELTWRFILKVLSILLVAVAVFGYYLYILKKEPKEFLKGSRRYVWVVSVLVLATVVYGFVLVGSPFKQRLVRFDEKKINDLQVIQSYVVNYWQQKEKLPESLADLKDSISGFTPPKDPQGGLEYGYNILGDLTFELCAEFNLEAQNVFGQFVYPETPIRVKPGNFVEENWGHQAGYVCFERIIDPELYKKS